MLRQEGFLPSGSGRQTTCRPGEGSEIGGHHCAAGDGPSHGHGPLCCRRFSGTFRMVSP